MWRIWLMFDPRRALVALVAFLAVLAFSIHFIVLSTDRFNRIEGPSAAVTEIDLTQAVAQKQPTALDVLS